MATNPLLEVDDLRTYFRTPDGVIKAVDGSSFTVRRGEIVTIVGESGSGKSVTGLTIMRLVPTPPAWIAGGRVLLDGEDLLRKTPVQMRAYRGRRIAMIFQNPASSLDPSYTIGWQMAEAIRAHERVSATESRKRCATMLEMVGLPPTIMDKYPHALSAGVNQRIMIAMALLCKPDLLIADEPTTNLDAYAQLEILSLLKQMKAELGIAILLITHDFATVAHMSDRVIVMYAGRIVEEADVTTILTNPRHPYTRGLLHSVPRVGVKSERLYQIEGQPVNLLDLPPGCAFAPRCAYSTDACWQLVPPEVTPGPGHRVRCVLEGELPAEERPYAGRTAH